MGTRSISWYKLTMAKNDCLPPDDGDEEPPPPPPPAGSEVVTTAIHAAPAVAPAIATDTVAAVSTAAVMFGSIVVFSVISSVELG